MVVILDEADNFDPNGHEWIPKKDEVSLVSETFNLTKSAEVGMNHGRHMIIIETEIVSSSIELVHVDDLFALSPTTCGRVEDSARPQQNPREIDRSEVSQAGL